MLPVYLLIGLINILVKHNNYGIKINDPEFHVKVRRSVQDTAVENAYRLHNNIENQLKPEVTRTKRYAYYKKIRIPNNGLPQTNTTGNIYPISNPAWNQLFNTSGNSNLRYNNGVPPIRSYPYGYPPGYTPKSTGYNNTATATPGYTNANSAPNFYNYQNPNRQNFGGYYGYNASSNFNSIPAPYTPGYTPKPVNNNLAPFDNNNYTNILAPYPSTTPNQNPDNRGYFSGYNNFNKAPIPYTTKPYLAPYTETNSNGYITNNATTAHIPGTATAPGKTTETTTPNIVTACVICNIPCPKFMRRFGRLCVSNKDDEDY